MSRARTRILYVEDDADLRAALADFLTDEGFEVVTAGSAEDAQALLAAHRFDAIVSDFELPGRDGASLLAHAFASGAITPAQALLLTASLNAVPPEGVELVQKPPKLDALVAALQRAAGGS